MEAGSTFSVESSSSSSSKALWTSLEGLKELQGAVGQVLEDELLEDEVLEESADQVNVEVVLRNFAMNLTEHHHHHHQLPRPSGSSLPSLGKRT